MKFQHLSDQEVRAYFYEGYVSEHSKPGSCDKQDCCICEMAALEKQTRIEH